MFDDSYIVAIADQNLLAWVKINRIREEHGRLISFVRFPYLQEIYMIDLLRLPEGLRHMVLMKGSQIGASTFTLLLELYLSGVHGINCLYILQKESIAQDFVREKVNKPIAYNPELQRLIRESPTGEQDNLSKKHVGKGTLAFIGAGSFKSVQTLSYDCLVVDEKELCDQHVINQARHRLDGSDLKLMVDLGYPKYARRGIHKDYTDGDQRVWQVRCPHCNDWQVLDFYTTVVPHKESKELLDRGWAPQCGRDIMPICTKCHQPLNRLSDGQWVAKVSLTQSFPTFAISQLFSPTRTLLDIFSNDYLNCIGDESKAADFHNLVLGEPHESAGDRITLDMLDKAAENSGYKLDGENCAPVQNAPTFGGFDPGKPNNGMIGELTSDRRLRVIDVFKVPTYNEGLRRFELAGVDLGVVDGMTDQSCTTEALNTERWMKNLLAAFYVALRPPQNFEPVHGCQININRTGILDLVKSLFARGRIILPENAKYIPGLYDELTSSVRVGVINKQGQLVYDWQEGSTPDHYLHALAYLVTAVIAQYGEKVFDEIADVKIEEEAKIEPPPRNNGDWEDDPDFEAL